MFNVFTDCVRNGKTCVIFIKSGYSSVYLEDEQDSAGEWETFNAIRGTIAEITEHLVHVVGTEIATAIPEESVDWLTVDQFDMLVPMHNVLHIATEDQ